MRRVFIDNNIMIDFLSKRRANHKEALEIFKNQKEDEIFCFSYGSLSDIFYVLKKEYGLDEIYMISFFKGIAKSNKYECLSLSDKYLEITCSYVENKISNNKKADLEDASQYFCALENKCDTIITNDKNFPKLDIALKRTNPNLEDYNPL